MNQVSNPEEKAGKDLFNISNNIPGEYKNEKGENVSIVEIKGAKEYLDTLFTLIDQSCSQPQK